MNLTSRDKSSIFIILVFFVLIVIVSELWRDKRAEDREERGKYTVGTINGTRKFRFWRYQFHYQQKKYTASTLMKEKYPMKIGDAVMVKFDPENPDNSEVVYGYRVPGPTENYSGKVWDSLPVSLSEKMK